MEQGNGIKRANDWLLQRYSTTPEQATPGGAFLRCGGGRVNLTPLLFECVRHFLNFSNFGLFNTFRARAISVA